MEMLAAWILGVLVVIAPPEKVHMKDERPEDVLTRYATTAKDMAHVIETRGPLFQGSQGALKTAALMLAITKFESELASDVADGRRRGDHNKSWCYMQINIDGRHVVWGDETMQSWTGQDLVTDWRKCFATGHEVLRVSLQGCRNYREGDILSMYTSGRCQSDEKKARHRWAYAQWILRRFAP